MYCSKAVNVLQLCCVCAATILCCIYVMYLCCPYVVREPWSFSFLKLCTSNLTFEFENFKLSLANLFWMVKFIVLFECWLSLSQGKSKRDVFDLVIFEGFSQNCYMPVQFTRDVSSHFRNLSLQICFILDRLIRTARIYVLCRRVTIM